MKKIYKNIICIILMILGAGIVTGTIILAKNNLKTTTSNNEMGAPNMAGMQPPGMNSDSNNSTDSSSSKNKRTNNTTNTDDVPTMPSNDTSESQPSGEPPAKPDGDTSGMGEMPTMPENNSDGNSSISFDMKNNNQGELIAKDSVVKLTTWYIVAIICGVLIFSVSLLYLILSLAGSRNVFTSFDKGIIFVLLTIIVTAGISYGVVYYTNNNILLTSSTTNNQESKQRDNSSNNVNSNGKKKVTGKETLNENYTSTDSDENSILITDGGDATIENATIDKSGDSANTESADFYGTNAAILVESSSTATIKNATITTNGKGANAVFSTGENSKIYISDSTIKTTGSSSSRGLDATYGGYIEGNNLSITTQGGSCATLATDRGEGTVKVSNSTLETNGAGSPIIYSTGDISITNTKGTANSSQLVVVEGKNSATVNSSTLYASAKGNRSGDVDQAGVMIYQSMSGDAGEGTGTFTAKDSSLNILTSSSNYKTAPMFFITNTDAVINLENTTLKFGSGVLLSAKGTSEWGKSGSNGGNVTLNATKQTLTGDIEIDSISTLTLNLKDSSTYKGTINNDDSAKSVTVNLSSNSKWTLTGNTYISELNDDDSTYSNIDLNGYKLYVNGKELSK